MDDFGKQGRLRYLKESNIDHECFVNKPVSFVTKTRLKPSRPMAAHWADRVLKARVTSKKLNLIKLWLQPKASHHVPKSEVLKSGIISLKCFIKSRTRRHDIFPTDKYFHPKPYPSINDSYTD